MFMVMGKNQFFPGLKLNDKIYFFDKEIAKELGISLEEYSDLLKSFDCYRPASGDYCYDNKQDCERCVEILNEKLPSYLVLKKITTGE